MAAHTITFPTNVFPKTRVHLWLKVGAASCLAFAGAYGLLYEHAYIASSDSIVSAYLLDVRTPIDGVVSGLPAAAGVPVHKGEVIGHLENVRVDHQELDSLTRETSRAEITATSALIEKAALEQEKSIFLRRAQEHNAAVVSRLELQGAEASRVLAARRLTRDQAATELQRGRSLHEAGILTSAAFDQLVSAQRIASEGVAAQEAQLASLREEAASAARGILSEPGVSTDVGYSRQRADEMAMRLSEINLMFTTATEQARRANDLLAMEKKRSDLLARTDLVAPTDGVLWNLEAVDGERLGTGDMVLSTIDCSRPFVLASVPQDRVPDIDLHGRAKLRLSGESMERYGTVVSVAGSTERSSRKFASRPVQKEGERVATVVIRLDGTASEDSQADSCIVGRTARVLIPTLPSVGLSGALAGIFQHRLWSSKDRR